MKFTDKIKEIIEDKESKEQQVDEAMFGYMKPEKSKIKFFDDNEEKATISHLKDIEKALSKNKKYKVSYNSNGHNIFIETEENGKKYKYRFTLSGRQSGD